MPLYPISSINFVRTKMPEWYIVILCHFVNSDKVTKTPPKAKPLETPLVKRESLTSGLFLALYVTGTSVLLYLWGFRLGASRFLSGRNSELLVDKAKALMQAKPAFMTLCNIKWFLL